jgi:hypothetical protein
MHRYFVEISLRYLVNEKFKIVRQLERHVVVQLVEVLCYQPEGSDFDFRLDH